MPSIPTTSPLGYIGILALAFGGFLILAGLGIINVRQVEVKSGRNTCIVGVFITLLGMVFLLPDLVKELSQPATPPSTGLVAATTPMTSSISSTQTAMPPTAIPLPATPIPTLAVVALTPTASPIPPTQTAMPPTSTPIPASDEGIIFAEYFESDANGWSTGEFESEHCQGAELTIEDGIYSIGVETKPDQGCSYWAMLPRQEFSDFVLTLEAKPGDAEDHFSYGIAFREDRAGKLTYEFEIGNDGLYAVNLVEDRGEWNKLKDWSSSDAIRAGETNDLMVIAKGQTLTFLVNGEELTTIEDDTLAQGAVGLVVDITQEGKSATVEFDNLIIKSVTDIQIPATNGEIIFAEYFESDANGWATGEFEDEYCLQETTIKEGKYSFSVETKPEQAEFFQKVVLPKQEFSDFILSLEATPHDDAEHYSYGLTFRENDVGHCYTFEISNDGLYSVSLFEGEWIPLKDWSSSEAIKTGQQNELTVIAKDEVLTFLVNEEELTTIEDDTLSQGKVGLIISMYEEDTSATVEFDNLIVRSAQPIVLPTNTPLSPTQPASSDEPLIPEQAAPGGYEVPEGKALFVFQNNSGEDFNVDVGPHLLEVPSGQTGQVALDPGTYTWKGHSPGGRYYIADGSGNVAFEFSVAAGDVYETGAN